MLVFLPEQEQAVVGLMCFSSSSLSLLALTTPDAPLKDKGCASDTGSSPGPLGAG